MSKRVRKSMARQQTKNESRRTNARWRSKQRVKMARNADLRSGNGNSQHTKRELECLVDYHSRLLARLTHELRNPLTSILGFAEILINYEKLTEAQIEFCQKIQNSALQIEEHLSLLADLARLDAGKNQLTLEEFSLADALCESCAVLERQARKQNASIKWRVEDGLPLIVSDRSKVRQVIYNFLAHAISRCPDGATVTAMAESSGHDFVLIIEDAGEPMSESSEMLVAQNSLPVNESIATTELGLVIARQLINALGAEVNFKSRKPRGLTVTLQIPSNSHTADASAAHSRRAELLT